LVAFFIFIFKKIPIYPLWDLNLGEKGQRRVTKRLPMKKQTRKDMACHFRSTQDEAFCFYHARKACKHRAMYKQFLSRNNSGTQTN
jgi:hypothetical protein